MFPLETKHSGGKLFSQSDLRGGVFLEEMLCRRYNNKKCEDQKEHHGYKIGTWNIRTLNPAGKLENLKTEMEKNEICNDRIIALKLKAEPVYILIMQVYMPTSEYEDDEVEKCMTQLKKFFRKME
ncbi:hypothetical protein B7P43_G16330 [Cryptotermes secundus]|uniref:Uncharacterized protein n=1 Tax=Cryptotermes secundus TaxID=105785 RepID=A0A2J7QWT9_9NEOP|nr:hypothetical protein B7P43_G16330 [Cryptotermes secundus]